MKRLKQYGYLYRQSPLISSYNHYCYRSLIIPSTSNTNSSLKFEYKVTTTYYIQTRYSNNDSSSSSSMSKEEQLKQSFIGKYSRKISGKRATPEAWSRYEKEIAGATTPQQKMYQDFQTPEYETPQEADYDPHKVLGIPRATFRGLIIALSCLIGGACFVVLRPSPIVKYLHFIFSGNFASK